MSRLRLANVGTIIAFALAVGCAPAATPPSPTTAPAKPAPAAPAAPAQPAAKPTEAAAKPAEKPAAAPAAAPAASPAAQPAVASVPKPAGNLEIKLGETAGISFSRVPSRITQDRLNASGWKIENVEFRGTDLIAEAVSSGDVHMARFQALDTFRTIQAGGKMKQLAEDRPEEFVIIAKKAITKCDDLNGKRYAVHSEGSPYTVMSAKWMTDTCGAKPNKLVIAGGENRIVALMNDQIDATFVQLSDWVNIETQRPGEFTLMMKFSEALPNLMGGVIVANTAWLEKNHDLAVAYVAEILADNRRVATDMKMVEEAVKKYGSEAEVKAFQKTYESYQRDLGGFPQNGGAAGRIGNALNLFTELGLVKPGLTPEQVSDPSIVEDALKIIGRTPAKL